MNIDTVIHGRHFYASPACPRDAFWIASNLREEDRLELERWYDPSPLEVIRASLKDSVMAWSAYRPDGMLVATWGVAKHPDGPSVGVPWMVGTDFIRECYRDFLDFSKYYDIIMSRYFHHLYNAVDAEYSGAIRWLEWLGYTDSAHTKSKKGYDYIIMYKDTSNVR